MSFLPAALICFFVLCRVAALDLPLLPGMARGIRRTAPVAVALLAVLYVAGLTPTVTADRALEAHATQWITDEVRYLDGQR
jgi:hypothetical protein